MKFEENLQRLEQISQELAEKNLPLEQALSLYQEGLELIKQSSKALEDAEKLVESQQESAKI